MEETFFTLLEKITGKSLKRKNSLIPSPFREDKNPSFSYFKWSGVWFFKDFGTGEVGTTVHLLCKISGVSYAEAMKLLNEKHIKSITPDIKKEDVEADYSVFPHKVEFKNTGYKDSFFEKIKIDKSICDLNHVTFGEAYTNSFRFDKAICYGNIKSIREDVVSAEKFYFPEQKKVRFLGNRKWHHVFGTQSISHFINKHYCFIGAGEKDTLVLQQVFNAPAICFGSETAVPNLDMLGWLKSLNKKFVIVYDNDSTGKAMEMKLKQKLDSAGITCTIRHLPMQHKDVTDMFVAEGKVTLIKP